MAFEAAVYHEGFPTMLADSCPGVVVQVHCPVMVTHHGYHVGVTKYVGDMPWRASPTLNFKRVRAHVFQYSNQQVQVGGFLSWLY